MEKKVRTSVVLNQEDVEFIDSLFPGKRSTVIRRIIAAYVRAKRKELENVQLDD